MHELRGGERLLISRYQKLTDEKRAGVFIADRFFGHGALN
jgi:hypothetical protein